MSFVTPMHFALVEDEFYRSAFPNRESFDYLKQLGLQSMVALQPDGLDSDLGAALRQFCEEEGIELLEADVGYNREPFAVMDSSEIEKVLTHVTTQENCNLPCLVFCTNGKERTSVVIACYRKIFQHWSFISLIQEVEDFSYPDFCASGLPEQSFIENFQMKMKIDKIDELELAGTET